MQRDAFCGICSRPNASQIIYSSFFFQMLTLSSRTCRKMNKYHLYSSYQFGYQFLFFSMSSWLSMSRQGFEYSQSSHVIAHFVSISFVRQNCKSHVMLCFCASTSPANENESYLNRTFSLLNLEAESNVVFTAAASHPLAITLKVLPTNIWGKRLQNL